jgi:hypothetical protein
MQSFGVEVSHAAIWAVGAFIDRPVVLGGFIAALTYMLWRESFPDSGGRRYLQLLPAMLLACVSLSMGVVVGAVVGYTVMFGPSHASGDFIGLPWRTMLPGPGAGLSSAVGAGAVAAALGTRVLRRLFGDR